MLPVVLYVGGNYNQNQNNGLFYRNGNNSASNTNANIGARQHGLRGIASKARVVAHRNGEDYVAGTRHSTIVRITIGGTAVRQTWRTMKRVGNLFEKLISDENLYRAIHEVNKSHHYIGKESLRRVNKVTLWVESTKDERVKELRSILQNGFVQKPMRRFKLYDVSAQKWRKICEPVQYPDQYIQHAVQQCLEPIMMRGMDYYCCGSIKGRGANRGVHYLKKWMHSDRAGTKYALECDIRHYYDNIDPKVAFRWFKKKIKDKRVLDTVWSIICNGITIGGMFSQWVANCVLQDIDQKIRQSGLCSHSIRYIDNFTILGSNKRKLKKLLKLLEGWLSELGLKLKRNKQIFRVDTRMVAALGFRFDHEKTYMRKRNLLSLRRKINSIMRKLRNNKRVCFFEAASVISKIGQLCHCDSYHLRRKLYTKGFITTMKNIIRLHTKRKENKRSWSFMLSRALQKQAALAS